MGMGDTERADWAFPTPGHDRPNFPDMVARTGNVPAVVEQGREVRPSFTADDLAHIDSSQADPGAAAPATAAGDDATALTLDAINKEIAEIEKVMREDRPLYNKKYAARYGELLAARATAAEAARGDARVQATIQAVRDGVSDAVAFEAAFNDLFASLPEEAQAAVRRELAEPPMEPARPASADAMAAFASTPEGAALVKEWGPAAPRKVAIVKARVARLVTGGTEALGRWVDDLTSADAKALWKALAGT